MHSGDFWASVDDLCVQGLRIQNSFESCWHHNRVCSYWIHLCNWPVSIMSYTVLRGKKVECFPHVVSSNNS